jgi:hypothetical protein
MRAISFIVFAALSFATSSQQSVMAGAYPKEMQDFLTKMMPRFQQLQRDSNNLKTNGLTGIWIAKKGDDNSKIDALHFSVLGPYLVEIILNVETGELNPNKIIGYGERKQSVWNGWFSIACKGCCPGKSWWDKGTAKYDRGSRSMTVVVDTVKLDPNSCEFTKTPDRVVLRSKALRRFKIGEIAPGKKIHIVAAPAIGNNSAQMKAAINLDWSYQGYGLSKVDIAARTQKGGQLIVNKSSKLKDRFQYVTTLAGKHEFLLVGYNSAGQPIHYEEQSIIVPTIPGLGTQN